MLHFGRFPKTHIGVRKRRFNSKTYFILKTKVAVQIDLL